MFVNTNQHRGFDWGALLSGIIFVVVGFYMFRHQNVALRSLVLVFSIISLIQGITWISSYVRFHETFRLSWVTLVSGILDVIIGLLFLFFTEIGALTISVMFAVWFLLDTLVSLIFVFHLREISTGFFVITLIFDIISLLIAIMMLMNPVVSALTLIFIVAFYFVVFGFKNIFVAIAHRM